MARGKGGIGGRGGLGGRGGIGGKGRIGGHGRRGGGRRGPSPMTVELMFMPPSSMYGYYFPIGSNGYDTTSYDASYSDNIVTQQDVDSLIQEIS